LLHKIASYIITTCTVTSTYKSSVIVYFPINTTMKILCVWCYSILLHVSAIHTNIHQVENWYTWR